MRGQFEGPRLRLDNEAQNLPIKTRLRKVPKETYVFLIINILAHEIQLNLDKCTTHF